MEWPLVGRDSVIRRVGALVARGHVAGIEIVGEEGVGKTRLARAMIRNLAEAGHTTQWIDASAATSDLPYQAFLETLPVPPGATHGPGLAAALRAVLAARAAPGTRLVVAVDDIHLLDDRSANLVRAASATGEAFVVLTRSAGRPAPEALRNPWKDGGLERLDLRPLTEEATARLLEQVLGGPVFPLSQVSMWGRSRGNPLYLRELVEGALEDGTLVLGPAGWQITAAAAPSARLTDLLLARLGRLTRGEREAVELLALAGGMDLTLLESLSGAEALENLEERGIIHIRRSGNRRDAALTHPLLAEVVARSTPELRAMRLKRSLADTLDRAGARRRGDLDRLALWRLEGGGAADATRLFAAAARRALGSFDGLLAERLARAALAGDPHDTGLRVVLAKAMASGERAEEASAVLVQAMARARTDREVADIAMTLADLLCFRSGLIEDACAVLEDARDRVPDPGMREEIDATIALVRGTGGDLPAVAAAGRRIADIPGARPGSAVRGLMEASVADVMLGRFADAEALVEVGLRLASRAHDEAPLASHVLRIARMMAAGYAGDVGRALKLGTAGHRAAVESAVPEVALAWSVSHALCLALSGRLDDAHRTILVALAIAREKDPLRMRGVATGIASVICAWLGLRGDAHYLRDEIIELPRAIDISTAIWLDRASVWVDWLDAGPDVAARSALAAGDRAAEHSHFVWAALLYHDAVRLGRADLVVGRLAAPGAAIGGDLVPCMAAHAEALHAGDADALIRVAGGFERLGVPLLAAEASAQAAAVHRRRGETQPGRLAATKASLLAASCQGARTPALADASELSLTPRELEVTRLVAAGLASRQVASRLGISVRTVDNHLGAIYDKLGVEGRGSLRALLGHAVPATGAADPPAAV